MNENDIKEQIDELKSQLECVNKQRQSIELNIEYLLDYSWLLQDGEQVLNQHLADGWLNND